MTILPPELPSFQSFVESTKYSLRPTNLPDRCSSCANADMSRAYELVDIHRHSPKDPSGLAEGFFWAASPSEDSTTCSSSSQSTCSMEDSDDQVMGEDVPGSPSSADEVSDAEPAKRRAYATKKKYLTEQQRYEIVCRVLSGEKQAHVARDYGVTRAAVSYLLKHHSEIMHRVLTTHANCCLQRAMATAAAMDTTS